MTFRFQGRRLDASQSEFGVANIKQKVFLDDTRSEMTFGTIKEEEKPANSTKKCIGMKSQWSNLKILNSVHIKDIMIFYGMLVDHNFIHENSYIAMRNWFCLYNWVGGEQRFNSQCI